MTEQWHQGRKPPRKDGLHLLCAKKVPLPDQHAADKFAEKQSERRGIHFHSYECEWCGYWHLRNGTKHNRKVEARKRAAQPDYNKRKREKYYAADPERKRVAYRRYRARKRAREAAEQIENGPTVPGEGECPGT